MYIANPCYEDWSKMTPVQHGRHCGQCSTVVLDMTRLSNDEILNLIKQTGGKCGRFYEDQLTPPAPPKGWLMQWLGGMQKDWMFASIVIMLQMNTPAEANAEIQNIEQLNQERKIFPIDSGVALPGYIYRGEQSCLHQMHLLLASLYFCTVNQEEKLLKRQRTIKVFLPLLFQIQSRVKIIL